MVSQHRATSHFSQIIETFLVTSLAEHSRHHLRVADGTGKYCLSRSSSLRTCVTAVGGLPTGLCTFLSCPACAKKFHSRVFRKPLCENFLPPNEEKRMWLFRMIRWNRWWKSFFVHFHLRRLIEYGWPFYLPYLRNPCGGYNPPQFAGLWPSHYYSRNCPLLERHVCLSKYVRNSVKCLVISAAVFHSLVSLYPYVKIKCKCNPVGLGQRGLSIST